MEQSKYLHAKCVLKYEVFFTIKLSPSRYLEHYGVMKIASSTGYSCEVTFKEANYFSNIKNEISGTIFDPKQSKVLSLGYSFYF